MFKPLTKKNTKKTVLKVVLLSLLVFISATGLSQDITRELKITNFTSIAVSSGISVYLNQDSVEKIKAIGSDTLLNDLVVIKEASGNLKIEMGNYLLQNWQWGKNEPLKVLITFKNLSKISLNNGASMCSTGELNFDNLIINSDDASNAKFDLKANNLQIFLINGSDIRLLGKTTLLQVEASNACNVKAFELKAESINAKFTNGSDGELHALKKIIIWAKNKCDVQFMGGYTLVKKLKKLEFSTIKEAKIK
ncbi:MAG: DUF2807 domain-containing protein [Sphingobacteriales bacterium]|nr:MAG: DUF2807 domain-containing protein [Sphingobacteriales bacterium]